MNILLLNDNPVVTKLVTLSAQKTGNEILIASNLEEISEGSYDLLIVDEALYTPDLFDQLKSKVSYKRSLYMLSRGSASVDEFDNEVKKPFLPTDLVELLSSIAITVANMQESVAKPDEIDEDEMAEDDFDMGDLTADEDDLEGLNFDLDSLNLDDMALEAENNGANSILDQDDVEEVKSLLDETEEDSLDDLAMDDLEDEFSFDDLDIEEKPATESKTEEITLDDEADDEVQFEDSLTDKEDELSIEEDMLLDDLMEEEFSLDELEDKIQTAVETLSSEDLEQEIDFDLDELSELETLDEKSLKMALGEDVEEECSMDDEISKEELIEDDVDLLEDIDEVAVETPSYEIAEQTNVDGVEALKTLLKALNNEDVVASLKGMNVSINISFGKNSDK